MLKQTFHSASKYRIKSRADEHSENKMKHTKVIKQNEYMYVLS